VEPSTGTSSRPALSPNATTDPSGGGHGRDDERTCGRACPWGRCPYLALGVTTLPGSVFAPQTSTATRSPGSGV